MGMLIIDNQYLNQAIALIKQALKEITISTFKIERSEKPKGRKIQELFDALIKKRESGVKVKLLFNWHKDEKSIARTNRPTGAYLKNHGIEIRYLKNNRCCHAKSMIVDNEKAIIGSHNLSVRSLSSNFEISYLITDESEAKNLTSVFSHSWNDAEKF